MTLYNLCRAHTATTGTGTVTIGDAVLGYNDFSSVPNDTTVSYGIHEGNQSEVGRGTYDATAKTMTRTTVLASTNGGSKITLDGKAEVYITALAEDIMDYGTSQHYQTLNLATGTTTKQPMKFTAGDLLTTPEAGSIEFNDGRFYVTGKGKQRAIDRSCGVLVATVTVADTAAETALWTEALSANAAKAGRVYQIHGDGVISNALAVDDITLNLYFGGSVVATVTPSGKSYVNAPWHTDFKFTVRTAGQSGTYAMFGHMLLDTTETYFASTGSIDTTAANSFTLKAQWNNKKVANTISINQAYLELKN